MSSPNRLPTGRGFLDKAYSVEQRLNALISGSAMTAYTPAWTASTTNPTIGNGTISGDYEQSGKLLFFKLKVTLGSTSTAGSGNYSFSVPVAAVNANSEAFPALANHSGGRFAGIGYLNTATAIVVERADGTTGFWGAAAPFVPASGDFYLISGFYEVP